MSKILIVDDSKFTRNRIKKALSESNHGLVEAANGEEALATVEVEQPDCILTDLLMPVMEGQEFLRRLRQGGSTIPVVVMTADIQSGSRAECEELGISGFLNKPVEAQKILDSVERALLQTSESAQ